MSGTDKLKIGNRLKVYTTFFEREAHEVEPGVAMIATAFRRAINERTPELAARPCQATS